MEKKALVSVIIPTYNRAQLIGEAVQSVQRQTYDAWELIIVDDGSNDNTPEVLSSFGDERISSYRIPHTGIIGKVRNEGMRYATGQYIAFLDSDDVWLPHKLEFQLARLAEHPEAWFIFGHGRQFGKGATPMPALESFFCGSVFIPQLIDHRFIFYVPTLLFRTEVLATVPAIDASLVSGGDYDFFLRMALRFTGIFCNEPVAGIRIHEQNSTPALEGVSFENHLHMIDGFLQEGSLTRAQYTKLAAEQFYSRGLAMLKRREPAEARRYFHKHLRLLPTNYKGWIRLAQAWVQDQLPDKAATTA